MRIHGGAGEIAGKTALNLNLLTRSVDANRSKAMINDAIKDDSRPISSTMELRATKNFLSSEEADTGKEKGGER